MELRIEKETLISDAQREFNTFYPYLRIEFFENLHPENKKPAKAKKIDPNKSICWLTKLSGSGRIDIDRKRTVAEVENDFAQTFGLSVQVFRKSANLWIETSLTDNWTLDKQNKEGESFNVHVSKSPEQRIEDKMIDLD